MGKKRMHVCISTTCGYYIVNTQPDFNDGKCPICGSDLIEASVNAKLEEGLAKFAEDVNPERINELKEEEESFFEKYAKPLAKVWEYVEALWKVLADPKAIWQHRAIAAAAIIYVISPIDLIPDVIPVIGFVDDILVILLVVYKLGSVVYSYMDEKNKEAQSLIRQVAVFFLPDSSKKLDGRIHEGRAWNISYMSIDRYRELGLNCTDGLPVRNKLYIPHENVRNLLVPVNEYEMVLAEEKWREYERTLALLNVKTVELSNVEYRATKVNLKAGADISKIFDGKLDVSGKNISVKKSRRKDKFDDNGSIDVKALFENALWLFRDPQLKLIVEKRLFLGYREGIIEYSSDIEFAINAKLVAKLKTTVGKIGLDTTLGFSRVGKLKIDLNFEFHPFVISNSDSKKLTRRTERLSQKRLEQLKGISVEL